MKAIPPRIHVLLARESPMAVVIRRGPSKQTAVLGWDRRTDEFEIGQWLKGRIYHYRCDISPDGKHWIYFAIKGETWTVVAETPWLKALDFYPKGDAWEGGGLFVSNTSYWLYDRHFTQTPKQRKTSRLKVLTGEGPYPSVIGNSECLGIYFRRLLRDGWVGSDKPKADKRLDRFAFQKPLNANWALVKFVYATLQHGEGKGVYHENHALLNNETGEVLPYEDWEWADVDGKRLVWAEKGFIRCATMTQQGLGVPRDLFDSNALTFQAIKAPY